ncbi:MAG: SOS response-associated peptidase [Candidatus Xenobia bacterium]
MTLATEMEKIKQQFGFEFDEPELVARYNVAPTQPILTVLEDATHHRHGEMMRWGLIPGWAKDVSIGNRFINVRSDTALERDPFRRYLSTRRCIILADGFYEWKRDASGRHPLWFHRPDRRPFALAGLWAEWHDIRSATVLTTDANALMAPIHDRMPVVLSDEQAAQWLDPAPHDVSRMLGPCDPGFLTMYPVSPLVNSPKNESPDCIKPADPPPTEQLSLF